MLHDSSIWRHRDLRIMLPARALSQFGDDLVLIVLLLRVFASGHGPWSVTGLLLCAALPVVVLAPVAGRLVDAVPFRPLAIAAGLWQAACCLGLATVDPLWAVYALVVLLQCGQVVSNPVWQAMVPSIAGPDEVGRVLGAGQALNTLAAVGAPATAGLLVGTIGFGAPFWVDAATFAGLAAAATAIRATRHGSTPEAKEESAGFSVWQDSLLRPLIF